MWRHYQSAGEMPNLPLIFNTDRARYFNTALRVLRIASRYPKVAWFQNTRALKAHAHQPGQQTHAWDWRCLLRLLPYFYNKIGRFFSFLGKKASCYNYTRNNNGWLFFVWYKNTRAVFSWLVRYILVSHSEPSNIIQLLLVPSLTCIQFWPTK